MATHKSAQLSYPPRQAAPMDRDSDGSPDPSSRPSMAQTNGDGQTASPQTPRRSSFRFLKRQGSTEPRGGNRRNVSGAKLSKKQRALAEEEALRRQREAAMVPKLPPRLPSHSALPKIDTFGGEGARPGSLAIASHRSSRHSVNAYGFSKLHMDQQRMAQAMPAFPPPPPPPLSAPASASSYIDYDPYPSTESMTHRGRYSYASSLASAVNSPRRVRRRKDPTPFNILVIGAKGCGKSSFIDFLRVALALPVKKRPHTPSPPATAVGLEDSLFTSEYLETEVDGERVGVTLWDSEGLEKNIVDFQLPVITSFVESKFEDTFGEEQRIVRAPGVKDTHIHCVFLILDPARLDANIMAARKKADGVKATGAPSSILDDNLDLNVLRELQSKTTVIPVISKADTITGAHMHHLKKTVWDTIKRAKLDPLEALNWYVDDDEVEVDRLDERDEDEYEGPENERAAAVLDKVLQRSSSEAARSVNSYRDPARSPSPSASSTFRKTHNRQSSALSTSLSRDDLDSPPLPLSIISPDPYDPEVLGRKFPWGFADPFKPEHCDFVKLRESVFSEWRSEIREVSRVQWYEGWRTQRLERSNNRRRTATSDGPAPKQLTLPIVGSRAASAGGQGHAQHHTTDF